MDLPEEYALARRARDGDREALAELVRRTRARLFQIAFADLRHFDDAQDAVGSALLRICERIGDLREPARVVAWMQSILRNEARQCLRRRRRDGGIGTAPGCELPDEDAESALRLDIRRALAVLPREEARAVALFYLARLPIREIARRVGRPEGTVKRWLHMGRRDLAGRLREYAPMADTQKVVILSSDPRFAGRLARAARAAGFAEVETLDSLPPLDRSGSGESLEYHLPTPILGARAVVLDEWIDGRSAFELYAVLKAAAEARGIALCLLASRPSESTMFAAWAAGFDMFLDRDAPDCLKDFERMLPRCAARV